MKLPWGGNQSEGGEATPPPDCVRRVHMRVVGRVQGVGFRWTCRKVATNLGLTGWVRNEDDGSVSLELQGAGVAISAFFTYILKEYRRYPIHYHIDEKEDIPVFAGERGFSVLY